MVRVVSGEGFWLGAVALFICLDERGPRPPTFLRFVGDSMVGRSKIRL